MAGSDGIAGDLGKIAVIGAGKMGEAIIAGLISGAGIAPNAIVAAEPSAERQAYLASTYGISCAVDGTSFGHLDTVILAVKPQAIREVMSELVAAWSFAPTRVISIAAGVPTTVFKEYFSTSAVVRVMPNIALTAQAGMSVVATASATPSSEGELVRELFATMGEALLVSEEQIDAATAISGSGPAYFALFVEELAAGGVSAGLSYELAATLARQTLIGTSALLLGSQDGLQDITPTQLRENVTSPGGTTQAALQSFAADNFTIIVRNAVYAAVQRARELS